MDIDSYCFQAIIDGKAVGTVRIMRVYLMCMHKKRGSRRLPLLELLCGEYLLAGLVAERKANKEALVELIVGALSIVQKLTATSNHHQQTTA